MRPLQFATRRRRYYPKAPVRRRCLTSVLVDRRPTGRAVLRFCLTACVRLRLSCKTLTRSTTLVGTGGAGAFVAISLCCAFCSMISISAVRYSSRYFSGSQETLMLSISACAIFSSLSLTAVVEPFFKTSAPRISLAKCISSRIRNKPSGFTAARCSRLLITTLATPILPVQLSALCKTA